jgi:hypothetical protein
MQKYFILDVKQLMINSMILPRGFHGFKFGENERQTLYHDLRKQLTWKTFINDCVYGNGGTGNSCHVRTRNSIYKIYV